MKILPDRYLVWRWICAVEWLKERVRPKPKVTLADYARIQAEVAAQIARQDALEAQWLEANHHRFPLVDGREMTCGPVMKIAQPTMAQIHECHEWVDERLSGKTRVSLEEWMP